MQLTVGRRRGWFFVSLVVASLVPALAHAQGTSGIAGVVPDIVPGSRTQFAAFTPGASMVADVGGSAGNDAGAIFTIHGSKSGDTRRLIDGMRWNSMEGTNSGTGFYFNPATAEEVAIQLGNNSAEFELGGVQVSLVPKVGANTFKGYFFATCTR